MEWHPAGWSVCLPVLINLPLQHKVQKFSSGTGSPGWSRKKGRKMAVVVVSKYQHVVINEQRCSLLLWYVIPAQRHFSYRYRRPYNRLKFSEIYILPSQNEILGTPLVTSPTHSSRCRWIISARLAAVFRASSQLSPMGWAMTAPNINDPRPVRAPRRPHSDKLFGRNCLVTVIRTSVLAPTIADKHRDGLRGDLKSAIIWPRDAADAETWYLVTLRRTCIQPQPSPSLTPCLLITPVTRKKG